MAIGGRATHCQHDCCCENYGVCEEEASRNARIREARVEEGSGSVLGWRVCSVRMPSASQYLVFSDAGDGDTVIGRHVDDDCFWQKVDCAARC
jgi:hypothetical protein